MSRSQPAITVLLITCALALAAGFRGIRPAPPTSFSAGPEMLEPRSGHSSTLLPDGRILIAGGMHRNHDFSRTAELYNPASNHFERTGDMITPRVGHIAVLLASGKVLIAGGWTMPEGATDTAELYDPGTQKFTALPPMTSRRARPSATLLQNGDVLLAAGSEGDQRALSSAEIFRTAARQFQATGGMQHSRIGHTATLLPDGRVLLAGGRDGAVTPTAELYTPASGKFTATGSLLTARYKHTAGLLPDGRVLVTGGSDEHDWHGVFASAELFDPRTGRFSATFPMIHPRFKLRSETVQLRSGKLLLAGGNSHAETFDPVSQKFAAVPGEMKDARYYMNETLLKDGRVLLTGGYFDNDQATARSWLYRP